MVTLWHQVKNTHAWRWHLTMCYRSTLHINKLLKEPLRQIYPCHYFCTGCGYKFSYSTKITEANLSAFIYRLFHEHLSSLGTTTVGYSQPPTCHMKLFLGGFVFGFVWFFLLLFLKVFFGGSYFYLFSLFILFYFYFMYFIFLFI